MSNRHPSRGLYGQRTDGRANFGQRFVQRRDSPPGPGNEMVHGEVRAMVDGSTSQPRGFHSRQPARPTEDWEMLDRDSSDSLGSDDYNDFTSIDNPPLRPGPNATTLGLEFELFVAVARGGEGIPDAHRHDPRWLSEALINLREESPGYCYTVRNKIIDELIRGGVAAHKTNEYWLPGFLGPNDPPETALEWWDSLEYENPDGTQNSNDPYLRYWPGGYLWNPEISDLWNELEAVRILKDQFIEYHHQNNLELYRTSKQRVRRCGDYLAAMIIGPATEESREKIRNLWYERTIADITAAKRRHYSASSLVTDPNIPVTKYDETYKAWSCTDDVSITEHWPELEDYIIPRGTLPIDSSTNTRVEPRTAYRWWGAEVRSSILDYDNPETLRTLRRVCGSLRDTLRIHKPSQRIRSGVHVHIGQQAGWTLLHLKKFATLWHLMEPSIYKLHREDRSKSMWCSPMTLHCNLARYIFLGEEECAAHCRTTPSGPARRVNEIQMGRFIPPIPIPKLKEYFTNIWQFESIRDLNDAMRSWSENETSIRWRVSGERLSDESSGQVIQTLEFRMLQGTLDAEHIWKWTSFLERLVVFARDSSPEIFRAALQDLLNSTLPDSIGLNKQDLDWFSRRQTIRGYFRYPDRNGKVNWGEPFMVPGYGDTHEPTPFPRT
ncbi:hypothetical protein O1611_g7442 [Lasiodiplodia mahajangana]|uniref:Uncharacterized protein n=1 Tax=Lasiodiplodia mahajangana TaxID=1108764 RepID=A0ACC2JFK1_9PEZI|nr:hypothetical protein O1611_g7442 [Lasiodiplodia mahajangana]